MGLELLRFHHLVVRTKLQMLREDGIPDAYHEEVRFLDEYEKMNKVESDARQKIKCRDAECLQAIDSLVGPGGDRLLTFFQLCLDHHMRKGSCMSSYIDLKQFKKNYSNFENLIASHADVDCKQQIISVEVPVNCKYYSGNQALVLVITKK